MKPDARDAQRPFAAAYLTEPARFPERMEGDSWGEASAETRLAGTNYRFVGLTKGQAGVLRRRFQASRVARSAAHRGGPTVEIPVFRREVGFFRRPDVYPGRILTLDADHRPDVVRLASDYWIGRIPLSPEPSGCIWTCIDKDEDQILGVIENFFRAFIAYRLLFDGGLLLHSSSALDGDRAFVFVGHSGAGKSTISRINLASGRGVLSDDMNAIVARDGGLWVEKVPFTGDFEPDETTPGSYPLAGICCLEKAPEHSLRDLPRPVALAALAGSCPYVNADRYRADLLMANLDRLLASVPCQVLSFSPDPGFWPLLRGG